jgi:hypothetical protein
MTRPEWIKLEGCPTHTEHYGDVGCIYQEGEYWIASLNRRYGWHIPCDTAAEARRIVTQEGG